MCGRFNIIDDPLTRLLMEITGSRGDWSISTQYNIAPTQSVPVLRFDAQSGWDLPSMRWWLVPAWSAGPDNKYSMFNARSETLASSRAFKEPFRRRRCIVPASGYYEWKKEAGAKVPYYIAPQSASGFAFAGLWDRWRSGDQVVESCTIVTAAAPDTMSALHHRIPVHLTNEQARAWVSLDATSSDLAQLLKPEIRINLTVTPVSTQVNNARNNDARCIEPLGDQVTIIAPPL